MPRAAAGTTIGIDLGGTKVFGVTMVGTEQQAEAKRPTDATSVDGVVASITGVIDDLGGTDGVSAIGIGAPGLIDCAAGHVLRAPNLQGFDQPVPLASLISDAVGGTPVALDNDVRVAVRGEYHLGAAKDDHDVLAIWVGTGVGGGLVLDGVLRVGPTNAAGEIGHVVVKPGGRRCGCGGRGHLESYAGRGSMELKARRLHAKGKKTKLVKLAGEERIRSSLWAKALAKKDKVALGLIDEAVEALAIAISAQVTVLDVPLVVLGGGLGDRLGAPFAARIEARTKQLLRIPDYPLRIVPSALGDRAGAVGAALLAGDHRDPNPRPDTFHLHAAKTAARTPTRSRTTKKAAAPAGDAVEKPA